MDNDLFWKRCGARATQRCWAEPAGERTLRYHYVCGHSVLQEFDSAWLARRMARWHSKEQGGAQGRCKLCCPRHGGMYHREQPQRRLPRKRPFR